MQRTLPCTPPAGVTPQLEAAKAREKVLAEQAQLLEAQLAAADGKVGAGPQGCRPLPLLQAQASPGWTFAVRLCGAA